MKKFIIVSAVLLFLIVPSFMFGASCDSDPDYYIKVAFEGEEYTLTFGHPDSSVHVPYGALVINEPLIAPQAPISDIIVFFGESEDEATLQNPVSFYIEVSASLYSPTAGVYTGDYLLNDNGNVRVFIIQEDTPYSYFSQSGTVNISAFGDVGSAIEGTFDATFIQGGDFAAFGIGDPTLSISGSFRVKRIAEEDLPPPILN
jgi:hypothetical protein